MFHRSFLFPLLVLLHGCSKSSTTDQPASDPSTIAAVIAAPTEDFNWPTVNSENGKFHVQLPAPKPAVVRDVQSAKGMIHFVIHKGNDMSGMFFNLSETTFPAGNAETFSSPIAMLEKLAEGVRVQKEHCITAYARPVEGAPCPAYEMRITYPGGFTGDGNQHASGYQVHRSFLIGDTVYQVFVDVLDAVKEPKPGMIDARIEHLFSSVRIDDTARGPGIAGSDSSVPADLK